MKIPYKEVPMQSAAVATGAGTAIDCLDTSVGDWPTLDCQVTGITTATITWQGTIDKTNWVSISAANLATGASATTATADGIYRMNVVGLKQVRANITAWTEGTIYVTGILSLGGDTVAPGGASVSVTSIAAGTNNIGDVDVLSIAAGTNTIGATRDAGAAWTQVYGLSGAVFASADASTATAVTDAPTAGQKLVIDDIIFSVDTAMQVDFEIETAGTVFLTQHCAANVVYQITPRGKFKLPTADKKLFVDTSAAGNIAVTVFYHSEA